VFGSNVLCHVRGVQGFEGIFEGGFIVFISHWWKKVKFEEYNLMKKGTKAWI
jgi:hypothetical protein